MLEDVRQRWASDKRWAFYKPIYDALRGVTGDDWSVFRFRPFHGVLWSFSFLSLTIDLQLHHDAHGAEELAPGINSLDYTYKLRPELGRRDPTCMSAACEV